jgi:hypothetical protein
MATITAMVVFLAVPNAQRVVLQTASGLVDGIRRQVAPRYEIEPPVSIQASSALEGHPARAAFDRVTNTWWASTGATPSLRVTFAAPIDLGSLIIQAGVEKEFVDYRRPATLVVTALDTGESVTLQLEDVGKEQSITDVNLNGTAEVEFKVTASRGDADLPLAISEIQIFAKR